MGSFTIQYDVDVSQAMAMLDKMNSQSHGAINLSLTRIGLEVSQRAASLAPVDTGALQVSIHSEPGDMEVVIADGVPYGIFQEYGTSRMSAQPFMRPALEQSSDYIEAELQEMISRLTN